MVALFTFLCYAIGGAAFVYCVITYSVMETTTNEVHRGVQYVVDSWQVELASGYIVCMHVGVD